MIDKKKLDDITNFLISNVFRNEELNFNEDIPDIPLSDDIDTDVIDIIATLHNLLYEAVTGERYNYMWHWSNKIGSWCSDDIFDDGYLDKVRKEMKEDNIF